MRAAIVDDLAEDREKLQKDVFRWMKENLDPPVTAPMLFDCGEVLLDNMKRTGEADSQRFDVIFLDIYMGDGMNGMDTARRIRDIDQDCCLVFTTQSPEFAVESYEVNSSWYLIKPYTYEKLSLALSRCRASLAESRESITVRGESGDEKLYLYDIVWTEYVNRHVIVHMKDGSSRPLSMRQGDFAELLLGYPCFCDCMKGVLVNFEAVDQLQKDRFLMKSGQSLPISRLKYQAVREQYLNYTFAKIREETI
ncbi:MAG: LytTR family DNA-binding domain-containing protein [Lachnospiraceae bacterium]|nr:LytTR family DNA-binding domain-containing protein [Lachnospiraceae bacterium]